MTTTPKTLTAFESHQLLKALLCKSGTPKQVRRGIRNYTMALLMLDAGLRVGEVVQLRTTDLWYGLCAVLSLVVRAGITKTKTERIIPLSSRIRAAVNQTAELLWNNNIGSDEQFAFYRTDPTVHMTTRQVERIIRRAALKSIGRPVHPHMLRHTFATRLMRKTNARVVQELLGHAHITTTQIYTHPNEDDKKKAIQEVGEDNAQNPIEIKELP